MRGERSMKCDEVRLQFVDPGHDRVATFVPVM